MGKYVGVSLEIRANRMQKQLQELSANGIRYARLETINRLAFKGRELWQEEMKGPLILKNRFTQRRAMVQRARSKNDDAILGHTEEYMRRLEYGISERAAKKWRAIPTEITAGQTRGSLLSGRKKKVRPSLNIKNLNDVEPTKIKGLSRKAATARAIWEARKKRKLILLRNVKKQGIYKVGKRGKPLLVYNLSRRVTRMPRIPTLQRTLKKTLVYGPPIAYRALAKQLRRLGVL